MAKPTCIACKGADGGGMTPAEVEAMINSMAEGKWRLIEDNSKLHELTEIKDIGNNKKATFMLKDTFIYAYTEIGTIGTSFIGQMFIPKGIVLISEDGIRMTSLRLYADANSAYPIAAAAAESMGVINLASTSKALDQKTPFTRLWRDYENVVYIGQRPQNSYIQSKNNGDIIQVNNTVNDLNTTTVLPMPRYPKEVTNTNTNFMVWVRD